METNVEEHNIGNPTEPKVIKLSSTLPARIKQQYIALFKEFIDVFAWDYKDLKSYDTSIIQHKIPLKEIRNLLDKEDKPCFIACSRKIN